MLLDVSYCRCKLCFNQLAELLRRIHATISDKHFFFPVGDGGSGNLQVLSFGFNLKCFFILNKDKSGSLVVLLC
jgi:hypothetical protein